MRKSIGLLLVISFIVSLVGSPGAFAQKKVYDPTAKMRLAVSKIGIEKKMNVTSTTPTITIIHLYPILPLWRNCFIPIALKNQKNISDVHRYNHS